MPTTRKATSEQRDATIDGMVKRVKGKGDPPPTVEELQPAVEAAQAKAEAKGQATKDADKAIERIDAKTSKEEQLARYQAHHHADRAWTVAISQLGTLTDAMTVLTEGAGSPEAKGPGATDGELEDEPSEHGVSDHGETTESEIDRRVKRAETTLKLDGTRETSAGSLGGAGAKDTQHQRRDLDQAAAPPQPQAAYEGMVEVLARSKRSLRMAPIKKIYRLFTTIHEHPEFFEMLNDGTLAASNELLAFPWQKRIAAMRGPELVGEFRQMIANLKKSPPVYPEKGMHGSILLGWRLFVEIVALYAVLHFGEECSLALVEIMALALYPPDQADRVDFDNKDICQHKVWKSPVSPAMLKILGENYRTDWRVLRLMHNKRLLTGEALRNDDMYQGWVDEGSFPPDDKLAMLPTKTENGAWHPDATVLVQGGVAPTTAALGAPRAQTNPPPGQLDLETVSQLIAQHRSASTVGSRTSNRTRGGGRQRQPAPTQPRQAPPSGTRLDGPHAAKYHNACWRCLHSNKHAKGPCPKPHSKYKPEDHTWLVRRAAQGLEEPE